MLLLANLSHLYFANPFLGYVILFFLCMFCWILQSTMHYSVFLLNSYFLQADKFWLLFVSLKKGLELFLFWVPDIASGLRFCKTSKTAYSAPQSQIWYKWCSSSFLSFGFSYQTDIFQMHHSQSTVLFKYLWLSGCHTLPHLNIAIKSSVSNPLILK